jgi:hypothetical protein
MQRSTVDFSSNASNKAADLIYCITPRLKQRLFAKSVNRYGKPITTSSTRERMGINDTRRREMKRRGQRRKKNEVGLWRRERGGHREEGKRWARRRKRGGHEGGKEVGTGRRGKKRWAPGGGKEVGNGRRDRVGTGRWERGGYGEVG